MAGRLWQDVDRKGERSFLSKVISSKNKVSKELFKALMAKGRSFVCHSFTARVFSDGTDLPPKFSVVVAKKLEKSAVKRNVIKRRFYSLIQPYIKIIKRGTVCALFVKKKLSMKDMKNTDLEIQIFLKKIKLI